MATNLAVLVPAVCLAFFLCGCHNSKEPSGPEVDLPLGRLVGNHLDQVREFLGVPFAAPPVRWLPPLPAEPWQGVRSAQTISPDCVRKGGWYTLNSEMSEDCLYLNIWAPPSELVVDRPAAVMVWFFGGGYYTGSSGDLQTRGDQLVRQHKDVVVVSGNYRLGVLGFLGSEEHREFVYRHTGLNTTGNNGFLDQVMLLKWVQQNIATFGGNPQRVMIFGESAGAGAVSTHMVSRMSDGLFQAAAMHSGAFAEWAAVGLEHASHNYVALVKSLRQLKQLHPQETWAEKWHCGPKLSDSDCLLGSDIPATRLVVDLAKADVYNFEDPSDWDGSEQSQWAPTVDGVVLKKQPLHAVLAGEFHSVPVILGLNKDEGTEFLDGCSNGDDAAGHPTCQMDDGLYSHLYDYFYPANFSQDEINDPRCFEDPLYKQWVGANFGEENVDTLYGLYNSKNGSTYTTNFWAADALVGDMVVYCSHRRAADVLAERVPVFEYYFNYTPTASPFKQENKTFVDDGGHDYIVDGFGACHGCELPFVFHRNDSKDYGVRGRGETHLATLMSSFWTNFAWTGNPNNGSSRRSANFTTSEMWPSSDGVPGLLVLDASSTEAKLHRPDTHPRGDVCGRFWNGYFEKSGWFPSKEGKLSASRNSRWIRRNNHRHLRSHLIRSDAHDEFFVGNNAWHVCFRNAEEAGQSQFVI